MDDEFLLSLLSYANKEKRISIKSEWDNIVKYCNEVKVAKYAHKLCQSSILAIGEDYVVVVVEHNHLAADLNNLSNQPGLTQFLKDKLNEELRVFAITSDKSKQLIEVFKTRAANNTLPDKVKVEIIKANKTKVTNDLENKAEEIFGQDGFIVKE